MKKKVEKLHYMHMNPLKRKLVEHPKDWTWEQLFILLEFQTPVDPRRPVR